MSRTFPREISGRSVRRVSRSAPPASVVHSRSISVPSGPPPVPAYFPQAAWLADKPVTAAGAVPGHPLVAEGEVVFDGIPRIEAPQSHGQLLSHPPVPGLSTDQADGLPHILHMRIDGHQKLGRRDLDPVAEIKVAPADHPTKKEEEALARAASRGAREEVEEPPGGPASKHGAKVLGHHPVDETLEGGSNVRVR